MKTETNVENMNIHDYFRIVQVANGKYRIQTRHEKDWIYDFVSEVEKDAYETLKECIEDMEMLFQKRKKIEQGRIDSKKAKEVIKVLSPEEIELSHEAEAPAVIPEGFVKATIHYRDGRVKNVLCPVDNTNRIYRLDEMLIEDDEDGVKKDE